MSLLTRTSPRFDIVIVHHSGDAIRLQRSIVSAWTCIASPFIGPDHRVTVVDHSFQGNPGWVVGANSGIRETDAPYVVLMNDDTEVRSNFWLEEMSRAFDEIPRLAAVVPGTDDPRWKGQRRSEERFRVVEPRLPENDAGSCPVSFWCVMFSREALNDVGLLDERFSPGYGDDTDWCYRAHLKGWKLAVASNVDVWHQGGASFKSDRAVIQAANEIKLREKYGAE